MTAGCPQEHPRDHRNQDAPGVVRCPRCRLVQLFDASEPGPGKALSRETRDDGPEVNVCSDCGAREALRPADWPPTPLSSWPLTVDEILEEDRVRYTFARRSAFSVRTLTPEDARRMLDDGCDDA